MQSRLVAADYLRMQPYFGLFSAAVPLIQSAQQIPAAILTENKAQEMNEIDFGDFVTNCDRLRMAAGDVVWPVWAAPQRGGIEGGSLRVSLDTFEGPGAGLGCCFGARAYSTYRKHIASLWAARSSKISTTEVSEIINPSPGN